MAGAGAPAVRPGPARPAPAAATASTTARSSLRVATFAAAIHGRRPRGAPTQLPTAWRRTSATWSPCSTDSASNAPGWWAIPGAATWRCTRARSRRPASWSSTRTTADTFRGSTGPAASTRPSRSRGTTGVAPGARECACRRPSSRGGTRGSGCGSSLPRGRSPSAAGRPRRAPAGAPRAFGGRT